jgi:hypothetical protein
VSSIVSLRTAYWGDGLKIRATRSNIDVRGLLLFETWERYGRDEVAACRSKGILRD